MKIVADDKIPFLRGALEPYADVEYLPGNAITNDELRDADALIIRTRTKCNEQLLRNTAVKFIGTATIGFDHIDTRYCEAENIFWTNAPGCNSSSVRQYIASSLVTIASDFSFNLRDKTLGIIGVGNVGSKVAMFATATGMRVLLNDPPRAAKEGRSSFSDLETVLREADIITLHVPLTLSGPDITFHLFDDDLFGRMKKGSWLFNSSRGEVVDTDSLKRAIGSGRLQGSVIDVWENEPVIDTDLLNKVYLATPHIAGYSTDGKANGTAMVVNSLSRFFNLPCVGWYPGNVPGPSSPVITIDCHGKSVDEIIRAAVLHTYDIRADDKGLRHAPADFEKLRGAYPLRREFTSFSVKPEKGSEEVIAALREIGFSIIRS